MDTDDSNIDLMWELSELESRLTQNPSASGYRDLARRYRELGWGQEAERLDQVATSLEPAKAAGAAAVPSLTGPVNPAILLDVVELLHHAGITGRLQVEAPLDHATLHFEAGEVVEVSTQEGFNGLDAFRHAFRLKGGRYRFTARPSDEEPPAPSLTDRTIELLRIAHAMVDPELRR